jgi:ribosome-associated protein
MDEDVTVRGSVRIPAHELQWRFSRSGGPGGQSVNTSDSRVELLYDVAGSPSLPPVWRQRALERLADRLTDGVVRVVAQDERSQYLNRKAALRRLGELLAEATAPPPRPRRATRPSRAAVQRRLDAKRHRSQTKQQRRPPD